VCTENTQKTLRECSWNVQRTFRLRQNAVLVLLCQTLQVCGGNIQGTFPECSRGSRRFQELLWMPGNTERRQVPRGRYLAVGTSRQVPHGDDDKGSSSGSAHLYFARQHKISLQPTLSSEIQVRASRRGASVVILMRTGNIQGTFPHRSGFRMFQELLWMPGDTEHRQVPRGGCSWGQRQRLLFRKRVPIFRSTAQDKLVAYVEEPLWSPP
jgi:hypothetical protein